MPLLTDPQQEAFAQARFIGKSLAESHYAAGYAGDTATASRLSRVPEIKERIAELYREAAAQTIYDKTHVVRDLLAVVHACASEAAEDNPLCEQRMGRHGPYYCFPPKLRAMARLIKIMNWDEPVEIKVELKDNFLDPDSESSSPPESCSHEPSASLEGPELPEELADSEIATGDPKGEGGGLSQPPTVKASLSARQEQFASARVKGLAVMEAYHAAGYTGETPNLAWRLNSMPAVKARIAELNGSVEAITGYGKDDAVRDLVAILRARPSDAGPDHPLSEMHRSAWGEYHRFPSKLATITLLAKLLAWAEPVQPQVEHDPDRGFKQLAGFIRQRS